MTDPDRATVAMLEATSSTQALERYRYELSERHHPAYYDDADWETVRLLTYTSPPEYRERAWVMWAHNVPAYDGLPPMGPRDRIIRCPDCGKSHVVLPFEHGRVRCRPCRTLRRRDRQRFYRQRGKA